MTLRLHYFDAHGRIEPIRQLLAHAKVEFEDVRYSFEEYPKAKESLTLEWGQIPVIEHDGHFYSQTQAMLRFLGTKHGYYPTDAVAAYKVDSIIDAVADLLTQFFKFGSFAPFPEDVKAKNYEEFLSGFFPKWLTAVENRLKSNSNHLYIVGDSLTIGDFALAGFFTLSFWNPLATEVAVAAEYLKKNHPLIVAYQENYNTLLAEYLAARKPSSW